MSVEYAKRSIARNVGKGFWKGPDVKLHIPEGQKEIPPCQSMEWYRVHFTLTKGHLFPTEWLTIHDLEAVKVAVKSRDAQSGMDVWENTTELVYQYLSSHKLFELEDALKSEQHPYTLVSNRAARPVILKDTKPLFRFYAPLSPPLMGNKLIEAVRDKEISFAGEEGHDWAILNDDHLNQYPVGIMARVKAASELWIPTSREPFYMDPDIKDYRGYLAELLKGLPDIAQAHKFLLKPHDDVLKIGETPHLTLSSRIEAELYKAVSPTITGDNWLNNIAGTHINSYLIDAGSSWSVRVEILSPFNDRRDRFVFFRFFNNELPR